MLESKKKNSFRRHNKNNPPLFLPKLSSTKISFKALLIMHEASIFLPLKSKMHTQCAYLYVQFSAGSIVIQKRGLIVIKRSFEPKKGPPQTFQFWVRSFSFPCWSLKRDANYKKKRALFSLRGLNLLAHY